MTREDSRFSFYPFFFIIVGPSSPTSKIPHRLKFLVSELAHIVSVGPGIRPQKFQRDNFTREPPCLQQSILGVPVCMKPSLTSVCFLSKGCLFPNSGLMIPAWGLLWTKMAEKTTYKMINVPD